MIYYFLTLLFGSIIAVMVISNGQLSNSYGLYASTLIIHFIGVITSAIILLFKKEKLTLKSKAPITAYLGGAIGYLTTVFNSFAFGKISVTSIVALSLLGQMVTSFIIDTIGLFGVKRTKFRLNFIFGLFISSIGVYLLIDFENINLISAIILSFSSGVTIVISRMINAKLSVEVGGLKGSYINHIVGLMVCIIVLLLFGRNEPIFTNFSFNPSIFAYLGGAFGVLVVYLSNITAFKISAFNFSIFGFFGQIMTGIIIDVIFIGNYSKIMVQGALIITFGTILNMIIEQYEKNKGKKEKEY